MRAHDHTTELKTYTAFIILIRLSSSRLAIIASPSVTSQTHSLSMKSQAHSLRRKMFFHGGFHLKKKKTSNCVHQEISPFWTDWCDVLRSVRYISLRFSFQYIISMNLVLCQSKTCRHACWTVFHCLSVPSALYLRPHYSTRLCSLHFN